MDTNPTELTDSEFHEYIEFHAGQITPKETAELRTNLPKIREEIGQMEVPAFPHVIAQLSFFADLAEAFLSGKADDVPYQAALEAMLALNYLHDGTDLIPDSLPEVGYMDDALIAHTVIRRNEEEYRRYAERQGVDWNTIAPASVEPQE
jgi:uncharacterized membrane protein YkvA (DUF1232 family)